MLHMHLVGSSKARLRKEVGWDLLLWLAKGGSEAALREKLRLRLQSLNGLLLLNLRDRESDL